ncbi:MAG: DUF2309 domain-containing protein [Proteobacteria bacterium]|nr:DUF2309 domain-containing protein [Pseudomonadota bacterium]
MNMMAQITAPERQLSRTEVAGLVALAARRVPPLWPLASAIATNPLAGFEHLPFAEAVASAARQFGAAATLPLDHWRNWLAAGRVDQAALRSAAVTRLGGIYRASAPVAAGLSRLDLLLARLLTMPSPAAAPPRRLADDAALIAKWCAAFFDRGQAAVPMPHRELGLYRAVLALLPHDRAFTALAGPAGRRLLLAVPRDPLAAVAEGLAVLDVPGGEISEWLAGLVARLPGWAGHIRWRSEHADPELSAGAPATMADLLALWLLLARAGVLSPAPAAPDTRPMPAALAAHCGLDLARLGPDRQVMVEEVARLDDATLGQLFMAAAEQTYLEGLVPQLERAITPPQASRPAAQLVFCIDVRSEPFRRALEAEGPYETLGYAGFFGLPIALRRDGAPHRERLLPVLLAPQHDLAEAPLPGHEAQAARLAAAQATGRHAASLFATAKQGPATAFATAEATGPLAAVLMAGRTLAPRLARRLQARLAPPREEALAPALHHHDPARTPFSLAEQVGYAATLFRLTGLPAQTARLVVLTGHGGAAVNNPYAAALDCGACGGHPGGANARVLAAMLNTPEVRAGLAAQGLALPAESWFLAAEHNTTTDAVTLFDRDAVPSSHLADLAQLESALARAGATNRARRARLLGRTPDALISAACDWAEVRPEWGLASNAAFVVGPRWWSRDVDLAGRAFLHSYDWQTDPDGAALATILTAPMVVAQWINCQYLFSTLDNQAYGSGDKTTQNVLGGIGVIQGNGGDLRIGLPRQSLFDDAGTPFHLPQRLLTVVLAPPDRVARVVAASPILGQLFGKGWVRLVVVDPATGQARRWRDDSEAAPEGTLPHEIVWTQETA